MFIDVVGIPAPQGSKKSIGNNRFVETSKKLPAWRKAVKEAAVAAKGNKETLTGPIYLEVMFFLPRPKTVGRSLPTVAPDLSQLVRAVEDSLTDAGIWTDDSYVVECLSAKFYADDREPGCTLKVTVL